MLSHGFPLREWLCFCCFLYPVTGLKEKMDHVSTYEKVFIGEFLFMESAVMLKWLLIGYYLIVFPTFIVHLLLWSFSLFCMFTVMKKMIFIFFTYAENIRALEEKLKCHETELQSKDNIISELSAQLESEKSKNEHQHQVEEISLSELACLTAFSKKLVGDHFSRICLLDQPYLQKTLQVKDLAVENLISEKEVIIYLLNLIVFSSSTVSITSVSNV